MFIVVTKHNNGKKCDYGIPPMLLILYIFSYTLSWYRTYALS